MYMRKCYIINKCIETGLPFLWPSHICLCFVARENREMNIQIFREVSEYVAHVDRVLSQPGGSLLMAGCSGVGRRTAVTLVAHCHRMELFTPKMSRAYSMKQFKNDLKGVCSTLCHRIKYIYVVWCNKEKKWVVCKKYQSWQTSETC